MVEVKAGAQAPPALPFRVGHGFDLHRLEPGLPFIIGGVKLEHDRGCAAHSDGDVLLHCVVDSILGALGLPDIGQLFPDNDPQWKGASSDVFMREAVRRMKDMGYRVGNIDCTIILQRPKFSPVKEQVKRNLCELLECAPEVVNVKAKTHEKVDSLAAAAMDPQAKLEALRAAMDEAKVDAYVVPTEDPHMSEYAPDCMARRAFISGFTGSAEEKKIAIQEEEIRH
eukprot:jgi/Pico_ML_1/51697/g267.t1